MSSARSGRDDAGVGARTGVRRRRPRSARIREPGGKRARHGRIGTIGARRRRRFDDVNFCLVARAVAAGDHEVEAVARYAEVEDHLPRIGPVVYETIGGLRVSETMEPDLTEILLLLGRYRSRLGETRVEKAVVDPRDRRELHPADGVRQVAAGRHVEHASS